MNLGDLKPDPRNARKHNPRNIGSITDSLNKVGAARSIVIDEDNVILAGNGLVEAAGIAGIENVKVVEADGKTVIAVRRTGLTKKQKAELAIYDNRTAELAEWDVPVLTGLADEVGLDLTSVDFTPDEISKLGDEFLNGNGQGSGTPDATQDEVPSDVEKRCKAGDLWQLGGHFILCGDCRKPADVAHLLGNALVNVAVTSPPYASQRKYDESSGFKPIPPDEYVGWWDAVQQNVRRHLAPDGSFFVNIKPHCEDGQRVLYVLDMVAAMVRTWGWRFVDEFCWRNTRDGVPGKWPNRLKNAWEPVYHFDLGGARLRHAAITHASEAVFDYSPNNAKARSGSGLLGSDKAGGYKEGEALPSNVLSAAAESGEGEHSAPFPVALPAFFIKAFSDTGDNVFEPFSGSGTTLIAAEQLGRVCYACEISPAYVDIALARWEKLTSGKAHKAD